jgi:hypothetical protein
MKELRTFPSLDPKNHQHTCPGCGVDTFGAAVPLQTPDKDPYGNLVEGGEKNLQCCGFHSYQCWLAYRREREAS